MPHELDRRTFLKRGGVALGFHALGASILAATCSDSDSGTDEATAGAGEGGGSDLTLRLPFVADMQVPDPDIMYEGEGLQVMLSVYEGLIDYVPDTDEFRPQLAESWEVADDLVTYTFALRPGVLFHDGTPADADAWVKSFERRAAIDQGAAYMVASVESTSAPDPTTFVVKLKAPNNAFLDYLACPWKPYAVSPTAVAANDVGGDLAQEWLKTHDAGTGPYVMSSFVPGTGYTLDYFEDWWGEKPDFTRVEISITPDPSTQRLLLESGEVDIVSKAMGYQDLIAFQSKPDFETHILEATSFITLWFNVNNGIMSDLALRKAVQSALDPAAILDPTYNGTVEVTTDFFSDAVIPTGVTPFEHEYDPSVLEGLVEDLGSKTIDLAYRESSGPPFRQMAELIQTQLAEYGLDVTVRGMPTSQMFALNTGPADQMPDLLLTTWGGGGDALHADTSCRIQLRTGAVPLNWFNYSNPEVDAEMDAALTEATEEATNAHYTTISELVQADALLMPLGRDVLGIVTRAGISSVEFNSYVRYIFDAAALQAE